MDPIKNESFCSACIKYPPPRCTLSYPCHSYPILSLPFLSQSCKTIQYRSALINRLQSRRSLDDPSFYMKTYHGTRRSRHSIRRTRATRSQWASPACLNIFEDATLSLVLILHPKDKNSLGVAISAARQDYLAMARSMFTSTFTSRVTRLVSQVRPLISSALQNKQFTNRLVGRWEPECPKSGVI